MFLEEVCNRIYFLNLVFTQFRGVVRVEEEEQEEEEEEEEEMVVVVVCVSNRSR